MRIHVRYRNVPRTSSLEGYILGRLTLALDRIDAHIQSVTVQLGRHGPTEVACRVAVHVLPDKRVTVEGRHAEARDAVDRSVEKIAQAVERTLGRLQSRRPARRQRPEEAVK
jgi:ribosome-associated translation inhibitor RaiA